MKKIVKNDLYDYENRFIYQLEDGFKFSLDSILLAEFVKLNNKVKIIMDLCCGNAPIPLILSKYTDALIYGMELQKEIFQLAQMSITDNNINNIKIINDDIKNINNYFVKYSFDIITCNPPYFKYFDKEHINNKDNLSLARHEIAIKLEEVFSIAKDYLKDNGSFYLVHRPERLDEIILLGEKMQMPVKEVQLVLTKNNNIPRLVLVKCQKKKALGIKMLPIININKITTYQGLFKE